MKRRNIPASVRQRLLQLSQATRQDYNTVLIRYGIERLLYRLSVSPYRSRFVLKGAQLFAVWHPVPHRVTRDLDLLGFGDCEGEALAKVFRNLCVQAVDDDGVVFDAESVKTEGIRPEDAYVGVRVTLIGMLGSARLSVQIDVGFGDSLAIEPEEIVFPCLLDQEPPHLRAYRRETTLAEKLQATMTLGMLNSRMKDYFDFWFLGRHFPFEGQRLADSVAATCNRRGRVLGDDVPIGLTEAFWSDDSRKAMWKAFWRKSVRQEPVVSLEEVVTFSAGFLIPPMLAAAQGAPFVRNWLPGGPWE